MSIEEIALKQAREYFTYSDASYPLIATDDEVKQLIEATYVGGWEAFRQRVFDEVVA